MSTENFDRRSFLQATAAGAVVAAGVAASPGAGAKVVLGGGAAVRPQMKLGDWTVTEVGRPEAGAAWVKVSHEATGRARKVSICAAESGSGAMASTGEVDLFLMNDGRDGQVRTPDDEVRMVRSLAKVLEGREAKLGRLMGKSERLERFDPIDHLDPMSVKS